LGYALKETPRSAGGLKDYFTLQTGRLGLTVEVGKDELWHPYPENRLPELYKQHDGTIEILVELAKELWIKYSS
jgi:hypothetical protein